MTTPIITDVSLSDWKAYCFADCSPTYRAMATSAALAQVQRYTMDATDMMEHPEGAWVYMDEVKRRLDEAIPLPLPPRIIACHQDGSSAGDLTIQATGKNSADGRDVLLVVLPEPPKPEPALSKDRIRDIFMAHGFTIKEGQTDLKQYVYDAAEALLSEAALSLGIKLAKQLAPELAGDLPYQFPVTTYKAPDGVTDWPAYSHEQRAEYAQAAVAAAAADRGQQHDEPTGPNHPGHHDGQTCEQAAQAQVDLHEMLYPGSQARKQYMERYSQFANSEYDDLNGADTPELRAKVDAYVRFFQTGEPAEHGPQYWSAIIAHIHELTQRAALFGASHTGWMVPWSADELIDFIGPHFISMDTEGDKENRRVLATIHDLRSMFRWAGAYEPVSEPVAWMCPNDPDAGSAFKWAKRGVDYSGLSCTNCQAKHVPVFRQASGQVYGIIDPDYGRIYTMVRKLAWEEGYAIGLHGSFTRDLDLVAVPWADGRRCSPEKLVARILQATGLKEAHGNPGLKPHGRKVWTLLLPEFGDPRFIDLSILPVPTSEKPV